MMNFSDCYTLCFDLLKPITILGEHSEVGQDNSLFIDLSSSLVCKIEMAKSKFEYVKEFEVSNACLPNTWIVIRIDGRSFHKFTDDHNFTKPNDMRCLLLMNKCAEQVMNEFKDIIISYGQSDEYSFIFKRKTKQFGRRENKLMSNIVSLFSSSFVFYWKEFFPHLFLKYPPMFDSRTVTYPAIENIKDYLSWRQADCHINNLYNTTFWALIQKGGYTNDKAEERLKGTLSSDKNEILFTDFEINYNNEKDIYKKGTILVRENYEEKIIISEERRKEIIERGYKVQEESLRTRTRVVPLHCDIISDSFWVENNILD